MLALLSCKRKKLTGNLQGEAKDDESKILDSRISSQAVVDQVFKGVKGIVTELNAEQMLVSESEKFNIKVRLSGKDQSTIHS